MGYVGQGGSDVVMHAPPPPKEEKEKTTEAPAKTPEEYAGMKAKDLIAEVKGIEDMTLLDAIGEAESEGKSRSSVLAAIQDRWEVLEAAKIVE